jgi:hypothetical protein
MENNTQKPTVENILNNTGITLSNTEAMVKQIGFNLTKVVRNGNKISLYGKENALETAKNVFIETSVRTIQYLNTKSVKRVTPFKKSEFERLMKQAEGEISLMPAYTFFVNVLVHNESNIGYALTFKPLVALNAKIFEAYLKGETPKSHTKLFPYFMGESIIPTKNGNMKVNFGNLNGNCGISLTNAQGAKVGLSYKHLPNSVYAMAQKISEIAKNEKVQTAQTSQQLSEILEGFKGSTL